MKYNGQKDYSHKQQPKIGVLITNLGTPTAPTAKALRTYLAEFLSDPRVVEIPKIIWMCILHGIILRIRPKRSAAAYKTVWTEAGSPLMVHTQNQAHALKKSLGDVYGDHIHVDFSMRYGEPSITTRIEEFQQAGINKLLVLPLYPQYSGATNGSTFDAVATDLLKRRRVPDLRFISHYHDYAPYIDAVAKSIRLYREANGSADKLLFSYHGVPLRYLKNGDPYHCECHKTSRLIAEKLGLNKDDYLVTFQSRFGREEWLKPYTDATLKSLPATGVKSVQVVCPGFSADCLETIEEIGVENREYFMESGGVEYNYIPALNDHESHIDALTELIKKNLQGWDLPEPDAGMQSQKHFEALEKTSR
ncbi:MAG: ferrochelatase [Cellvibrionaceae bacterium]|jgi:ferrochelatase